MAEEVCRWLLASLPLLFGLCLISMMPWGDLGLDARARAHTHTHTHTHTHIILTVRKRKCTHIR